MAEEEVVPVVGSPTVDFSYQFNMIREKTEKKIFSFLCDVSKRLFKEQRRIGVLVVLGRFDNAAEGMRFFGKHKIEKYTNVLFQNYEAEVMRIFESGDDGAIIINQGGELLGTGVYLVVENPNLEIPEGTGTRHISAASFSEREDVLATFTLSEETLSVRLWKNGALAEHYNPEEDEEENGVTK
jgi:DNA integrity scanning protein DisA with diadenylate cyclase activity